MTSLEVASILLGLLIIFTRLPAAIWPKKFVAYWMRKVKNKKTVKNLALASAAVGLIVMYFILGEVSLFQLLIAGISFAMFGVGMMIYLIPEVPSTILKTFKKNTQLLQTAGIIAVAFGILLVLMGLF